MRMPTPGVDRSSEPLTLIRPTVFYCSALAVQFDPRCPPPPDSRSMVAPSSWFGLPYGAMDVGTLMFRCFVDRFNWGEVKRSGPLARAARSVVPVA